MSCDLTDPQLKSAYDEIKDGGSTSWLIAGYRDTKDVISLYEKGTGDFNEMRTKILEKEEVLFAFIRVEGKFALITYISDKANGVRRARALVHGRAVAAVFKENNLSLALTTPAELSEANIRSKLRLDSLAKSKGSLNNIAASVGKSNNNLSESGRVHANQDAPLSKKKSTDELATPEKKTNAAAIEPLAPPPMEALPPVPQVVPYSEPPKVRDVKAEQTVKEEKVVNVPAARQASPIKGSEAIKNNASNKQHNPPAAAVIASKPLENAQREDDLESLNVQGFINMQKGSLWKRRYYRVGDGSLSLLSIFPHAKVTAVFNLASIDKVTSADAEIIVRHSLKIEFKAGTKEATEFRGPLIVYLDDSASYQEFTQKLGA